MRTSLRMVASVNDSSPSIFELQNNSWRGGEVARPIHQPTSRPSFLCLSLTAITFPLSLTTATLPIPSILPDQTLPMCRLHISLEKSNITKLIQIPRGHSTDCGWPVDWPSKSFNPNHFTDMKFSEYGLCNLMNKVRHLHVWPLMCYAGFKTWNDGFSRCFFVHRCWNSIFHWLMLYEWIWDPILQL